MELLECLPLGVGHADEGVCLLVRMGSHRILLDCGLSNIQPLIAGLEKSSPIDLALCTHAHSDHARGLSALHKAFPQMPIYASEVTTHLLSLDRNKATACQALPWRSPMEFREGLSAELFPSGHLPGAAAMLLTYTTKERSYKVFYTGDFLLSNSRLVDGLPLEDLRGIKPDVLIVEGSYGTARFPHRRQQENQLAERIHRAVADRQSVLLPTPALGLGQELLMLLRSHHHFTGRDLNIWVDGSVAIGCNAYLDMLSHFPTTVQNFARHQPLFWDERIRPRVRQFPIGVSPEEKRALLEHSPCIVLTDKSVDLSQYFQSTPHSTTQPWLILVPQQPGRIGSIEAAIAQKLAASLELQTQLQTGQLMLETYLLGDHCDGSSTTQLIHNLRPQHVIFVHGSPAYLSDLTSLEELQNRYHLHMPAAGTRVELPIGETFLQPAAPEIHYEAEINEFNAAVSITLPNVVVDDPRWQSFADTGLVEARWQGEELVLRGLTPRELLQQSEVAPDIQTECCGNCLHCRGQRCWNPASPLLGFKVTPDGYCPAFAPSPLMQKFPEKEQN
ncbi:MAG: MBL fold metallo-hydrolase [Drouetiella hepatica Uher 2000/2452]|jgi:Cft2 family RNA processing exonuclease|uniref:MBL fold metallo-hydrolase n=1 Tax=Drouetiella hepatica Uher 2000/2452 TaxID=904376 RepID=A0A951QC68_9CYAN|nr:MBL fold metallo-hydrolase [Drouetiella hepatica Uher 2000/2452]